MKVIMDERVMERARRVSVLLMDCDGVLTDGRIILLPDGQEIKAFNSHDGHGLKLAKRAGIHTGVITGRRSGALDQRIRETGIEFDFQAAKDKVACLKEIVSNLGIAEDQIAFVGDDLPDLPVMRRVGFAVAVANSVDEVLAAAHYVTKRTGGKGAIRETIEVIMKAQGKWEEGDDLFFT